MRLLKLYHEASPVSISAKEFAVLAAVKSINEPAVADLLDVIARATRKPPRAATLYEIVQSLHEKGLLRVSAVREGWGRPTKLYQVTDTGLLALELADQMLGSWLTKTKNSPS